MKNEKHVIKKVVLLSEGTYTCEQIDALMQEQVQEPEQVKLRIICPECKKQGVIFISRDDIKFKHGLTSFIIKEGIICDHMILVYIDKNFNVRGCEVPVLYYDEKHQEKRKKHRQKTHLMKEYEKKTGKNAIWRGKVTKQFKRWKGSLKN